MQKVPSEHTLDPHFSNQSHPNLTLEPLRSDGADALDTQGLGDILEIILRELEIAFPNALHDVTIRKSDNLFAHAGSQAHPELIPPAGMLAGATFDVRFKGQEKPIILRIRPPHVLELEPPCDPKPLLALLETRGFMIAQKLAKTLGILGLAFASAFSPLLDTDLDGDDDDDQRRCIHLARG